MLDGHILKNYNLCGKSNVIGCNKKRYNENVAKIIESVKRRAPGGKKYHYEAYECSICGHWHVVSQKKKRNN